MKKNLYYIFYIGVLMMFLAGCQDEAMFSTDSDEPVTVSYRVKVGDDLQSRTIGDGTKANKLSILVLDNYKNRVLRKDLGWPITDASELNLTLLKGDYKVLFWLQYSDTYSIADNGQVSVSYANNWEGTFAQMENWDAFYSVDELSIDNDTQPKEVVLNRPVGQLNWGDENLKPKTGTHRVVVTLKGVSTTFNPIPTAVEETQTLSEEEGITFVFTDFAGNEMLNESYNYLSTNYLFPVQGLKATFDFQKAEGTSIKQVEINDGSITIESNKRTNVLGATVLEPEAPVGWDGVTLRQPDLAEGHYIIDEPSDLAWLASDNNNLSEAATFLVTENLDMASKEIASVKLPGGSTFDGGSKTIKNFANSLFGNATNLTVQNLVLDNVQATSDGHVGVLVNTLKGNGTFTNVSVSNSSATTEDGAAGGMVGYIRRIKETTASDVRTESLEVTFSNCDLAVVTANGTQSEGKFVGLLSGYDNDETLSFDANCSATNITLDYESPYKKENQSVWLFIEAEDGSKENNFSDETYDGWLGTETYRRGNVTFEGKRLVPKWDGNTSIDPIVENNVKLIYSPYDVAKLQKNSHTAVIFEANVDLGSYKFDPIKSITTLDGKEYTIYNLKVDMIHDLQYGAAFIQYTSGTTTHKDLNFVGAYIHNDHDKTIPIPEYGNEDDGGAGNAYAGTLIATVGGTYNVSNIHVMKGTVSAVCKMGGLIGRVGGVMTMENCSVKEYLLENYEANIPNYYNVPPYDIANLGIVHGLQWWYTQGECGGLIGFIQSTSTIIRGCSVTDTDINCYGQPDKSVVANVWAKTSFENNPLYTSGKNLLGKANTDIAGRHVNQFIGDVVSQRSEGGTNYVVTIEDYEVSGNKYWGNDANSTNDYNHNYENGKYCEVVGCAYYVGVDVDALGVKRHIMYCAGELTFNKKGDTKTTITEAVGSGNSIAWKGGSFTGLQTTIFIWSPKSEYPTPPPA